MDEGVDYEIDYDRMNKTGEVVKIPIKKHSKIDGNPHTSGIIQLTTREFDSLFSQDLITIEYLPPPFCFDRNYSIKLKYNDLYIEVKD